MAPQLGLHGGQLQPQRNDFVPALQGGGHALAGPPARDNARGVNQFAVLRGESHARMASAQFCRVVQIGGQGHVMQNTAHQTLQVVGLATDAVSSPTQRAPPVPGPGSGK